MSIDPLLLLPGFIIRSLGYQCNRHLHTGCTGRGGKAMANQRLMEHWINALKNANNLEEYNILLTQMENELTEAECEEVLEVLEEQNDLEV